MKFQDWWVDGHYISALSATAARQEAARLFGFEPHSVRRWTRADQKDLHA